MRFTEIVGQKKYYGHTTQRFWRRYPWKEFIFNWILLKWLWKKRRDRNRWHFPIKLAPRKKLKASRCPNSRAKGKEGSKPKVHPTTSTNRVNTTIMTKIHTLIRSEANFIIPYSYSSLKIQTTRQLQRLWSGSQVLGTFLLLAKRALNKWLRSGGDDSNCRCFLCFSCILDNGCWSTRATATPIVALLLPETRRVITAINRSSRASMESGNGETEEETQVLTS